MPTDLSKRPDYVQEARSKVVKELTALVGHRCEITGKYGQTDLHEFIGQSKAIHDDEVSCFLITHPFNIIVLDHNLHINQKPSLETCLAAIRNRSNKIWLHFGFANYYEAMIDFRSKLQGFYKSGQIKTPLLYFPKN